MGDPEGCRYLGVLPSSFSGVRGGGGQVVGFSREEGSYVAVGDRFVGRWGLGGSLTITSVSVVVRVRGGVSWG